MFSIIHAGEGKRNIGYSSDSIKMWRLITQHNPSTLVSVLKKLKLYNDLENMILDQMQTTMDRFLGSSALRVQSLQED